MQTYNAYYTDGKSAERIDITISLLPTCLQLIDLDGEIIGQWPYLGLQLSDEVYQGKPVRFCHSKHGDAQISVSDHQILNQLSHLSVSPASIRHGSNKKIVSWALLLVALFATAVIVLTQMTSMLVRLVPVSMEQNLGKQVIAGLVEEEEICATTDEKTVLRRLVGKLSQGLETAYQFRVSVSNHSDINALAAPGGHILIYKGLIDFANSPNEIAAVLAHEMAHVVKQHSTQAIIRIYGTSTVIQLMLGGASNLGASLAELGVLLLNLSHSRDAESEADRYGAQILINAGLDSSGLGNFFERLDEKMPDLPKELSFLLTHPFNESRIEELRPFMKSGESALSNDEWQALKKVCG
ncbi:MAG: M48 family metallopeptidase [Gammaproteobacteria bacterium]